MAQKKSDEERKMLINLVGEHFIKTGQSTREIAAYFTQLGFPLSNFTVSDYINKYKASHQDEKAVIDELIQNNTPKGIEDVGVRTRVMYVTKFFLQDHTVEDIALAFNVTPSVIYRDLNERLPIIEEKHSQYFPKDNESSSSTMKGFYEFLKIDAEESVSSIVQDKLREHSINNLETPKHK